MGPIFVGIRHGGTGVVALCRDGRKVTKLNPRHDVWKFGDGNLDWTTSDGAKQVTLAMLLRSTRDTSISTLWCEDIADSLFHGSENSEVFIVTSVDLLKEIMGMMQRELFGNFPPPGKRYREDRPSDN